jgi:uncharacterized MAPEG superfamily protein
MMMSTTLTYLAWTVLFTALLWIPYILNALQVRGLTEAMGYPASPKPLAPWAERAKKAHYNAVENLVIFAPAVVLAHITGAANDTTATAALVYLLARIVHYVVYALGIPYARTLSFTVGWVCTIVVVWQVLG